MDSLLTCPVCDQPRHSQATYCKRCKRLLDRVDIRRKPDKAARVRALHDAWDGECFRCHYTGVRLAEDDHHSPLYITFDHVVPRHETEVVLVAACINDMKTDFSDVEFRRVVLELAKRFSGGDFDSACLEDLEHFKR